MVSTTNNLFEMEVSKAISSVRSYKIAKKNL